MRSYFNLPLINHKPALYNGSMYDRDSVAHRPSCVCATLNSLGGFSSFQHDPCKIQFGSKPDLFSRRFREGISFPNFLERSILKLPLSKLCVVAFVLQNRALFKREKREGEEVPRKGEEEGWPAKEAKRKKDA